MFLSFSHVFKTRAKVGGKYDDMYETAPTRSHSFLNRRVLDFATRVDAPVSLASLGIFAYLLDPKDSVISGPINNLL